MLNRLGLVAAWDCDTANVHDSRFHQLIDRFTDHMVILGDMGFHSPKRDPANLKLCRSGGWNERIKIETVLSMLTVVRHVKKMRHRVWDYFKARLICLMAAFNILTQWNGFCPDEKGIVRLSTAQFTLLNPSTSTIGYVNVLMASSAL